MRVALRVATVVAVGCAAGVVTGGSAGAAQCAVMTFEFGSSGLELSPSSLTVDAGGCVQFNNQTLFTARFTVGSAYRQDVPALSQTSGRTNYVAHPAGTRQPVTASEGAGSAKGVIVIKASAAPKPTVTPSPARTSAHHPTPKPTRRPAPPPSAKPQQATPTVTLPPPTFPATPVTSPAPTLSAAPPFLAGRPTPSPTPSVAVVSGPLQPPTGRGTGLPAALAALAVVATGGALLRVLMAEPIALVDDGRSVGAAL